MKTGPMFEVARSVRTLIGPDPQVIADASWAKVVWAGLNLTDEVNDQFLDPDNRSSFYHHYGRQFMIGFRYTH